jgi:dolichyl-phosphate-mannose-protein mannosyltransferase
LAWVVVVAGGIVRFHTLGAQDFDPREIAVINGVDRLRHPQTARAVASAEAVPLPVAYVATRVAMRWGYAEELLRVPSAIAGTSTLAVVWCLGQAVFGAEAALYATALLATSALHVNLSRSVGSEAWLTLWTVLTVLAFCRAGTTAPAPGRWVLFAALAAAMALSSYAGLLVLAVLAAYAIVAERRSHLRPAVPASILAAIPLGAWAFFHPPQMGGSYFGVQFGWRLIVKVMEALASNPDVQVIAVILFAAVVVGAVTGGRPTSVIVAWAAVGVGGMVMADWLAQGALESEQLGFVLPAYHLLAGLGLTRVRAGVTAALVPRRIAAHAAAPLNAAMLLAVLAMDMPALSAALRRQGPSWRDAAAAVATNARPDDRIVALHDRTSFVFYAPELERRVPPLVPPARATSYFARAPRGWLIVPAETRLYPGWPLVPRWMATLASVNLSVGGGLDVFYLGRLGRKQLLGEVAYFTLPTAVLVRGSLLLDLLQEVGPLDPVLWKVDQIALSPATPELRNPALLQAVYYLAQHEHGDRAASLAYRLATADASWSEAREALAAFQPNSAYQMNF